MPHDISRLQNKIERLHKSMSSFEDSATLLKIIRRPGWTTPAEFLLVEASLESIQRQVEAAAEQYKRLVDAAGHIGASGTVAA